ncbi:lytic polysaccharide monooxygenase [Periconia macrospinosa]|uniref:AA9 family lytic polysaccharide monooxygenase n=1 Tax=Periconia macrospinosa TaxID=97972 RepID=A0A2V1E227_9PLEO|nr:lytic polysaccharide monooxygenase [Periconia macrospinosa]
MKTQSVLVAALAAAPSVLAHTAFTNFYIDGVDQGDGVAVRLRKDPAKTTYPIDDYSSKDLACNVDGTKGVSRVQPIKDGSTLTFEMRSWPDDTSKQSLDPGHKGPCAFYLKKVASAVDDPGAGDGWFKLYDQGYDKSKDSWCTDDLIANKGRFSVKIPQNLAGGYYLARPEVLALHNASEGNGQFYTGCGQIFVDSKGDLVPEKSSTVSIPGYVKAGDPSVMFNIYNKKNDQYKVAGPPVAKLVSGVSKASSGAVTQTEGLKPAGCILENGNWCGKEVSSYSDEKGCWASGEECWAQDKVCWASAGPTGGKGCKIWQEKCKAMNDACKAKNFNGPPNKDKDLTPKKTTIDVGTVLGSLLEIVKGDPAAAPAPVQSSSGNKPEPSSAAAEEEPSEEPSEASAAPSYQAAPSEASAAPSYQPTPSQAEQPKQSTSGNKPYSKSRPSYKPIVTPAPNAVVTNVHTEVVKVYQTVTVEGYKRRRGVHHRRMGGL